MHKFVNGLYGGMMPQRFLLFPDRAFLLLPHDKNFFKKFYSGHKACFSQDYDLFVSTKENFDTNLTGMYRIIT